MSQGGTPLRREARPAANDTLALVKLTDHGDRRPERARISGPADGPLTRAAVPLRACPAALVVVMAIDTEYALAQPPVSRFPPR